MSTAIIYQWIYDLNNNVKISHHQRDKGHGVIPENIKETDLLIIVDSSSNSEKEVFELLENKVVKDIIIIDHHPTNGEINNINNVVLINPQQPGDEYPNKSTSGGLVVTKFLEYCELKLKESNINYNKTESLLDLTAISIVSDVMDVSEMENRYYYYKGTEVVNNLGLAVLLEKMRVYCSKVTSEDLAFKLNKALNSTLRLQDIVSLFRLIIKYESGKDNDLVKKIIENVSLRENIEKNIIKSIDILYDGQGVILAKNNYEGKESIKNNFNGVIASNMAQSYEKNVAILGNNLSGSARAYKNFNFKEYINNSNEATGAGHSGAFGIKINNLEKLKEYFISHPPLFEIDRGFDIEIDFKDLSKSLFKEVEGLQYLVGNGFEKIKFKISNVDIEDIKKTINDNVYYTSKKTKQYIRFVDKTLGDKNIKVGNTVCVLGTLNLSNLFGQEYYQIYCYDIDVINNKQNEEWGYW